MAASTISSLLTSISKGCTTYQDYYQEKGYSVPDDHCNPQDGPSELPPNVELARQAAREACMELYDRLSKPQEIVLDAAPASTRVMALDVIYTYKLGYQLGWGEKTTYTDLAKAHGLDAEDVKRMLRLAMAHRIFHETDDGMIVHTAASYTLATSRGLSAWVGLLTKENWPPMLQIADELGKHPGSEEPLESEQAYAVAHKLVEPAFKTWEKDPERIRRFSDGMEYVFAGVGLDFKEVLKDLAIKSAQTPLFVDVGGSKGHVSIGIARAYQDWKFVVQDSAQTIAVGREELPTDLTSRVDFVVHDFWQVQPIKNADVYFFRMIFHDWSDKYGARILRNLIPALKPGARIIISDACLPPKGAVSLFQERWLRGYDVVMKCFTNGKERDVEGWATLFAKADASFKFLGVRMPPGSKEALIEAEWAPTEIVSLKQEDRYLPESTRLSLHYAYMDYSTNGGNTHH
ncbi:hypothetical protein G7054_g4417 [Neopestalotiopsis clavispora]|nr:hypothetical protein G7054_g4417 [Neopestalotiopsis clavispora]